MPCPNKRITLPCGPKNSLSNITQYLHSVCSALHHTWASSFHGQHIFPHAISSLLILQVVSDTLMDLLFVSHMCFFLWRYDPTRAMASSFLRFLYHTQRRTTVCRTPLDEWSARRRDLYLTTHDTHNRQTSMPRWDSNPRSQQGSGRRSTP